MNHSATGPTLWQSADAGTWQHTYAGQWSCFDGSAWYTTTGFNVAPADVWFHGFGANAGYDEFYIPTGESRYTQDHVHFWQHVDSTGAWTYFDTVTWTVTDKLGDAQYDTGLYGPTDTWFQASSSSVYAGDWVYIGEGTTYYSLNHSATGPTSETVPKLMHVGGKNPAQNRHRCRSPLGVHNFDPSAVWDCR